MERDPFCVGQKVNYEESGRPEKESKVRTRSQKAKGHVEQQFPLWSK